MTTIPFPGAAVCFQQFQLFFFFFLVNVSVFKYLGRLNDKNDFRVKRTTNSLVDEESLYLFCTLPLIFPC